MGSLIFNCPTRWKVIEPGIETDKTTYDRIRACSVSVKCPHCTSAHQFKIGDGYLFQMGPRRKHIHSPELLCDEIDVGSFIVRSLSETVPEVRRK